MQFDVYRNTGKAEIYPLVLDVQSDIIGRRKTRMAIPLFPHENYKGPRAERLTPILVIEGQKYVMMTHEMASVPEKALREDVENISGQAVVIKSALDFLFDGI
ncbi:MULTISPECIES: CcdB family protein [Pantoea]|jgi:toxin CcdB|uniref:Toxin CcdB n=1 Tax=Pantoea vagans TaxID=470934 RepID=A0ABY3LCC8_9GAMM|nr:MULTISPECIES: CcdB family protein [Pantoea]MBK5016241.1 CcdB family protein [Pantoea sp. S62]PAW35345.1 cytotoxin [Pantoea vagans]TXL76152.1 cytotoxin [Pantoea vagans]